jgi:glycosyltransferase involved in cell wall biosynthesis
MTLDEADNLPGCLDSLAFCREVLVLDSGSKDGTPEVAASLGAKVFSREMDDWSTQQNWALNNLPLACEWLLMVDADERVDEELATAVRGATSSPEISAYRLSRRDWFMGRPITRVQPAARLVRMFRPEKVSFSRLVNPAVRVAGKTGDLPGRLEHYPFSKGLGQWISRHRRYAALEAKECLSALDSEQAFSLAKALFAENPEERRRQQKGLFQRMPARPALRFAYLYLYRRGFLDGAPGLAYALLQAVYEHWIRLEMEKSATGKLEKNH